MSPAFDLATLLGGIGLLALIEALAWVALGWLGHRARRGAIWLFGANLCFLLAVLAAARRSDGIDYLSLHVAAALVLLGLAQVWIGIARFLGVAAATPLQWLPPFVALLVLSIVPARADAVPLVQALVAIGAAGVFLGMVSGLRGAAESLFGRRWTRPLVLTLWLMVGFTLLRVLLLLRALLGGAPMTEAAEGWRLLVVLCIVFWLNGMAQAAVLGLLVRRLRELARRDQLTGVLNREAVLSRLRTEFAARQRHGSACTLMLFELLELKRINDARGQQAGDEALRRLVALLGQVLGAGDSLGRLGGAQFAVVLVGGDASAARACGERLQALLSGAAEPLQVDWVVAAADQTVDDAGVLLRRAEAALVTRRRRPAAEATEAS